MLYFVIGLVILLVGGYLYGKFTDKQFGPDDTRSTPAVAKQDGVDFVPMKAWKNTLINLLNIAGTGPVLGPIQGILFGPIAFLTIPIGCVLAGAVHDYFNGMIATRNGGAQMPKIITKYLGKGTRGIYLIFSSILLMLVGVVFVYTPGDLIVGDILKQPTAATNSVVWIVYGLMRTRDAVSPNIAGSQVMFSLIGFGLLYSLLLIVGLYLMIYHIRKGPDPAGTPAPNTTSST